MARPSAPLPGAVPTVDPTAQRSAVVGRYAKIKIDASGVRPLDGAHLADVVLLFDWEVNVNFDYADSTAHGDRWKTRVFMDGDWTARARGYVVPVDANTYIKNATQADATGPPAVAGGPILLYFVGYSDITATTVLWAGNCYIKSGRISVPMALAEQEFEMIGAGAPGAGVLFG